MSDVGELTEVTPDEQDFARAMLACSYYRGVGTCDGGASCGYFGEPKCITDEPYGGWKGVLRAPLEPAEALADRLDAEAVERFMADERARIYEYEIAESEHRAAAGYPDWEEYEDG